MKVTHRIHHVIPCLLLVLSGCALPEGAITVNTQISRSLQEQHVEVERALEWAVAPYYQQLKDLRPRVLDMTLYGERRDRAIKEWRRKETATILENMKNGSISGISGSKQIETIASKTPDPKVMDRLIESTPLSSKDIDAATKAVDAKYRLAKSGIDAEVNKVVATLRTNNQKIIAANDKITQALEKQQNTRLEVVKVVQTGLTIAPPQLPGLDILKNIVKQFGSSNTAKQEPGREADNK